MFVRSPDRSDKQLTINQDVLIRRDNNRTARSFLVKIVDTISRYCASLPSRREHTLMEKGGSTLMLKKLGIGES